MDAGCLNSWSGHSEKSTDSTQTSHHEGLHEDSIIRCTKEGPTRNKQEALYVNGASALTLVLPPSTLFTPGPARFP